MLNNQRKAARIIAVLALTPAVVAVPALAGPTPPPIMLVGPPGAHKPLDPAAIDDLHAALLQDKPEAIESYLSPLTSTEYGHITRSDHTFVRETVGKGMTGFSAALGTLRSKLGPPSQVGCQGYEKPGLAVVCTLFFGDPARHASLLILAQPHVFFYVRIIYLAV